MLDICGRILRGKNCFIFGEATWNLHPILPMQQLKAGATQIALITGKKIIPTIMEYVEVPNVCKKVKAYCIFWKAYNSYSGRWTFSSDRSGSG